mmetsp:Transcript_41038/g.86098  ORF Transcript_41038/g.86098 Transcript_41038/m.86098 type:complete len:89 (+) Transcript_41038:214-480(+)
MMPSNAQAGTMTVPRAKFVSQISTFAPTLPLFRQVTHHQWDQAQQHQQAIISVELTFLLRETIVRLLSHAQRGAINVAIWDRVTLVLV